MNGFAATTVRHTLGFASNPARENALRGARSLVVCAAAGVKVKTSYQCSECGETSQQWMGRCNKCGAWNTMQKVELVEESSKGSRVGGGGGVAAVRAALPAQSKPSSKPFEGPPPGAKSEAQPPAFKRQRGWVNGSDRPQRVSDVSRRGFGKHWRLPLWGETGEELARVLGGGVVPGSLTLIGGDPGVGKSTLLLQLAGILAQIPPLEGAKSQETHPVSDSQTVLYVSAEESVEQVGSRAERMGLHDNDNIFLYSETRIVNILREMAAMQPRAVIVDSIQTVYLDDVSGSAGSITQVRECATALLHMAKSEHVPVFLVGHVTKQGDIAGPRVLEHIVDAVLYMEGERHQTFRLLRGIKNRYGATDEIGVFTMGEAGLMPVSNPSALFLSDRTEPGGASSAVSVIIEGTRPLLVEIQALCTPTHSQAQGPLRAPNGLLRNRLFQILAVLAKYAAIKTYAVDIHANVVGGLNITEPATDLAVAVAIASSVCEQQVPSKMAFIGELGLGGELRPVAHLERRILEAAKLGFESCVVPASSGKVGAKAGNHIRIIPCSNVARALQASGVVSS